MLEKTKAETTTDSQYKVQTMTNQQQKEQEKRQ